MQFPNAYSGVKDIYTAAILTLVGVGLGVILLLATGLNLAALIGILAIVVALVMIVAFVSNIVGIVKASKDEAAFKNALYALLAAIVISIIGNFSKDAFLSGIFNVLSGICSFLITYMICRGIVNLADELGDVAVSDAGEKVMKLEIIIWVVSIVVNLISALLGANASVVSIILSLVSSIASIVAYILYIGLLGKAKQMLA